MPFVALEGKFPQHPKLLGFSRSDRFTWVEILCYCAEYRTKGYIPGRIQDVIRQATPKLLRQFAEVGLLDLVYDPDRGGQGYAIHDWEEFNGTGAERRAAKERKQRQREREKADGLLAANDDIPF